MKVWALQLVLAVGHFTIYAGAELAESGSTDDVLLSVVLAVRGYFSAVSASEATAQTVKVSAVPWELAVREVAAKRGFKPLKVIQNQVVHPIVVLGVLVHVCSATEFVATVLSGTMIMGHLQGELAWWIFAVFIQIVTPESFQHHPFIQHFAGRSGLASFTKRGHILNDPESFFGSRSCWHGDGVPCN